MSYTVKEYAPPLGHCVELVTDSVGKTIATGLLDREDAEQVARHLNRQLEAAPPLGTLVKHVETGGLGRVVAFDYNQGLLEVRVANEWVAAITGRAVFDADPEWWCPFDVETVAPAAPATA